MTSPSAEAKVDSSAARPGSMPGGLLIGEQVDEDDVEGDVRERLHPASLEELLGIAFETPHAGRLGDGLHLLQGRELRGVLDLPTDVEADEAQGHGDEERDPPAPGAHLVGSECLVEEEYDEGCEQEPGQGAHLEPAAAEASALRR